MVEKAKDADLITTSSDGTKTLNLHVLVKTVIQQCMGKAIDYARVSGMSDRSFQQFERLVKDDFYRIIEYSQKLMNDHGYHDETK